MGTVKSKTATVLFCLAGLATSNPAIILRADDAYPCLGNGTSSSKPGPPRTAVAPAPCRLPEGLLGRYRGAFLTVNSILDRILVPTHECAGLVAKSAKLACPCHTLLSSPNLMNYLENRPAGSQELTLFLKKLSKHLGPNEQAAVLRSLHQVDPETFAQFIVDVNATPCEGG